MGKYLFLDPDTHTRVTATAKGYRIRSVAPNGDLIDTVRVDRDDAIGCAKRLAAAYIEAAGGNVTRTGATVADVAVHMLDPERNGQDWNEGTWDNHELYLRTRIIPVIGQLPTADWQPAHTQEVLDRARPDLAAGTLRNVYSTLRTLAGFAKGRGYQLPGDPCEGVTPNVKENRYVDPEDVPTWDWIERLADEMTTVYREPWRALQVKTAALTGLRAGELHGLTPKALVFDGNEPAIHVFQQVHTKTKALVLPKGGKKRHTVLPAELEHDLQRRATEAGSADAPLFPNPHHPDEFQSHTQFSHHLWLPARRNIGWPESWKWHSLRHYFCSHYINELGCPVVDVARAAGHSTPMTTWERYVNASRGAIQGLRGRRADHDPGCDIRKSG